ncbi:MAG TPA: hypothetical protein VKM36_06140 [Balneolaceae bacterium]|nr:hypothetical protein [Balneolaceae bacterium]
MSRPAEQARLQKTISGPDLFQQPFKMLGDTDGKPRITLIQILPVPIGLRFPGFYEIAADGVVGMRVFIATYQSSLQDVFSVLNFQ